MWVYNKIFVTGVKTQTGLLSTYDKVQHASPELTMQQGFEFSIYMF
jgi:hypothetical protein